MFLESNYTSSPEAEAKRIIARIRKQFRILSRVWSDLLRKAKEWQQELDLNLPVSSITSPDVYIKWSYWNGIFSLVCYKLMSEFHSTSDSLQGRLEGAERDVSQWENVDDIILENLHEHITVCKVA